MSSVARIFEHRVAGASEEVKVAFPSGEIVLGGARNASDHDALSRSVEPGIYAGRVFRISDELMASHDAAPTCGIHGIVVDFSDGEIATWEQARTRGGDRPVDADDLVDIVLTDRASVEAVDEEIEEVLDDCLTDGHGSCSDDAALVVYVGEVAVEHGFHWALDATGAPLKLFGYFLYPDEAWDAPEGTGPDAGPAAKSRVTVTLNDTRYALAVPDDAGAVAVEEFDGDTADVRIGDGLAIEISTLVLSGPDPEHGYIQRKRRDLTENGTIRSVISDEDQVIFFEAERDGEPDFRFISVRKAGDEYYEIREHPAERPFDREAVEAMMRIASTFALAE